MTESKQVSPAVRKILLEAADEIRAASLIESGRQAYWESVGRPPSVTFHKIIANRNSLADRLEALAKTTKRTLRTKGRK